MSKFVKQTAIIGLGGQGRGHYVAYQDVPEVKVVAVCESNAERLGRLH